MVTFPSPLFPVPHDMHPLFPQPLSWLQVAVAATLRASDVPIQEEAVLADGGGYSVDALLVGTKVDFIHHPSSHCHFFLKITLVEGVSVGSISFVWCTALALT